MQRVRVEDDRRRSTSRAAHASHEDGEVGRSRSRRRSGGDTARNGRSSARSERTASHAKDGRTAGIIWRILGAVKDLLLAVLSLLFNLVRLLVTTLPGRVILLVATIVLAVFLISTNVTQCSQDGQGDSSPVEQSGTHYARYNPSTSDVASLQIGSDGVATFTLNAATPDVTPTLSDEQTQKINDALEPFISNDRTVGFMLVNLNTGMGIGYDIDGEVYAASSLKGPYAAFVCKLIDEGQISRDTQCANTWNNDSGSTRDEPYYSVESLMQDMIIYSDNNAFRFLRSSYDSLGFEQYLSDMQADTSIMDERYFAHYSARTSATMWTAIYQYLQQADENENAAWLKELMSETEVSFIRDGVTSLNMNATVYNKAGWCADSDDTSPSGDANGVCDSAIVVEGSTPYLLTVMTGAPYTEANAQLVSELASAVLDARWTLDSMSVAVLQDAQGVSVAVDQIGHALGTVLTEEKK